MHSELDRDEERQFLYRDEYQHARERQAGRPRRLVSGIIAGAAGGLAAAAVMNLFQQAVSRAAETVASDSDSDSHGAQSLQPQSQQPPPSDRQPSQQDERDEDEQDEDATMKAAEALSESITGERLTKEGRQTGGTLVHYAFSMTMGALYGALAEVSPRAASGFGTPFGAALWLGADEIGVPALGLSKGPTEVPGSTHVQALAAHLVYGLTTDSVRRLIRGAL